MATYHMETDVEFSRCGGTLEKKTLSFEMFQISESGLPNLYFVFNLTPHHRLKFLSLSQNPGCGKPAVCSGVALT